MDSGTQLFLGVVQANCTAGTTKVKIVVIYLYIEFAKKRTIINYNTSIFNLPGF